MLRPVSLFEWKNKEVADSGLIAKESQNHWIGSRCSACLSWSSMEEKKRHRASAEAMAPRKAWRSPKETMSFTEYCKRRRSAAHCALNNSIFALRRSEVRRAIPICFLDSSFDIYCSSVPQRFPGSARACRSHTFWGRLSQHSWLRQDAACGIKSFAGIRLLYIVN